MSQPLAHRADLLIAVPVMVDHHGRDVAFWRILRPSRMGRSIWMTLEPPPCCDWQSQGPSYDAQG